MRSAGARLAAAGSRLAASLEQFDATIASHGQPWGGDHIGMLIGTAYDAAVDYAMGNFFSAADEIVSAGEDVTAMAEAYSRTETATRLMFTGGE